MTIRIASYKDLNIVHQLAEQIWWEAYKGILADEQIEFMLADMYSLTSLMQQMEQGAVFILAEDSSRPLGFASFSANKEVYKIHKLYILPDQQGKGIGSKLLGFIEEEAKKRQANFLELNVNRNNPSLKFYEKVGFEIQKEVDVPYHQFILNDYLMQRKIQY